MRYRICKHILIKSENAAKPEGHASKHLKDILNRLCLAPNVFDFGCGKLRYLDEMKQTSMQLFLVDSEIQLSRSQKIHGTTTTIKDVVRSANTLSAVNVADFEDSAVEFDRGFCVNMLSVIPIVTTRKRVVRLIERKPKRGGACLFVVQYRNSEFTKMVKREDAVRHEDGILLNGTRGYSFYGLIQPEQLRGLVEECGLRATDFHVHDGSAFLWAEKRG